MDLQKSASSTIRRDRNRAMPAWLHRHNDLSELAVALQIAMNFRHVIELERSIDDGLERTAFDALEDIFHRGLAACLVAYGRKKAIPLDGRHLGDHLQYGQCSGTLAARAVDVDGAPQGQRGDQLREIRAADRIEGDARALAVGDAHNFGDQILLFGW